MQKKGLRYEQAVEQLAQVLSLSDDAIRIAEGWSILPEGMQRHVKLVIDDYVSSHHPVLRRLYDAASHADQARINRVIEAWQAENHGRLPPAIDE